MDPMLASSMTPMGIMKPYMRGFATAIIAAVGAALCGMVGSLAYPIGGTGMIYGIILGLLVFGSLGVVSTGFWRDVFPQISNFKMETLMPESMQAAIGDRGTLHLLLNVIEAQHVEVQGAMPWSSPDLYVQTTTGQSRGENPTHNTCVRKPDGSGIAKWNEQVRLRISPFENEILFRIKNQDLFGSSDVGYVVVDVKNDICMPGFPEKQGFAIQAGTTDQLRFPGGERRVPKLFLGFVNLDPERVSDLAQIDESRRASESILQSQVPKSYGAADQNPNIHVAHYVSSLQYTDRRIADHFV